MNNFTDREILKHIFNNYLEDFKAYEKNPQIRDSKIYVPIDIRKIATALEMDAELVFGRLYYHLDKKYRYKQENGANVDFFIFKRNENEYHSINFPLLSAVLADLEDSHRRFSTPLLVSLCALATSIISLIFSIVT